MAYKACPIQRGPVTRTIKKQRYINWVIFLLVLVFAGICILIPARKIILGYKIDRMEAQCISIMQRKQERISELETLVEIVE